MATKINSYREMNATDLVKQWKKLVNDSVMAGRDAHMFKELLLKASPIQIMAGMYWYQNSTITVPQFVKQVNEWLYDDEFEAELILASDISHTTPPEYYTYFDLKEEETAYAYQQVAVAKVRLQEWVNRVLS